MREVIDQLLQGKYIYSQRSLDFSTARIELSVVPGESVEGSFTIFGPENAPTYGTISSTEIRMEVVTGEFSGSPYEASYRFDARGLSQGDVIKGDFRVISNQGEFILPFVVTVRLNHIASSLGDIKNLFHFANLAKTDWDEAVDLFYSREFISIFKGNDAQYESLYRGLSVNPDNVQNVEEFLISINKKQPVKYETIPEAMELDFTGLSHEHGLIVTKNGWGYTSLKVRVDGDFIALDKYELADDDFNGSSARIKVRLKTDHLHEGNNFGRIVLYNHFVETTVPVKVTVKLTGKHPTADYQEKKKLLVDLIRVYENFSCKKIKSREWLSETGKIITKMNAIDDEDLETRLYTAHYYITAGRVNEGKWILDQAAKEVEEAPGDTLYSYYLYLSTLCSREDAFINDISERLEGIFRRNPDNWRIAWLLLYIAEEYSTSTPRKWMVLEEQFSFGCRSPILYLESMNLLNDSPSILTRLDEYELYVLEYGAKRKIISLNLIDQIVYLSLRVRNYDSRLYRILKTCYELRANDEVLEAIVSLLIKGGITDRFAFEWYRKGVERQLRITRLYEYYMMSIYTDENGLLPCDISRMVLMYFSYQSDLEYDKNAILYRYIHEHKEDYPELFESYVPQIEKFLMAQLDKGRITADLAYLYKNMITRQMVDATNASKVLNILYTAEIKTSDRNVNAIVVIYDKLEREMRYSLVDGRAYVPLYGSDYAVLLADHEDNRYSCSVPFTTTRLMPPGKLSAYAIPYIQKGRENLDLFLCDLGKNAYTIDMDNVSRYRDLAESEFVRLGCRNEIRNELVKFYYDNDFTRQLTEYLMDMDPKLLGTGERSDILELMVMSGLYERALEWVKEYGTYGIDPKIILRLCVRLLDRGLLESSAKELEIAHSAFRSGKYDEQLLDYLVNNYNGTIKEMRDIWKAAKAFGLDTYGLSERMIVQMLYSGSFIGEKIDVFKSYVKSGANSDIEMAFLAQSSYDSFVHGKVTDRYIFERIDKLTREGLPIQDVCKLAYLKYYAGDSSSQEEIDEEVAASFLKELLSKNIMLPFYMEYQDLVPDMVQFIDKTMLEYRTAPGSDCIVHYRLANDSSNEYQVRQMQEMYDGIYVTDFILFFGEQMQYYITEEGQDEGTHTQSGTIQKSDIVREHLTGRFSMINDIMIGETLQDYGTVDNLMAEFFKKRYISEQLFFPVDGDQKEEG